jgi:hypothetical protein
MSNTTPQGKGWWDDPSWAEQREPVVALFARTTSLAQRLEPSIEERALRFGWAARRAHPSADAWDHMLETQLRADWKRASEGAAPWDLVYETVRSAWAIADFRRRLN